MKEGKGYYVIDQSNLKVDGKYIDILDFFQGYPTGVSLKTNINYNTYLQIPAIYWGKEDIASYKNNRYETSLRELSPKVIFSRTVLLGKVIGKERKNWAVVLVSNHGEDEACMIPNSDIQRFVINEELIMQYMKEKDYHCLFDQCKIQTKKSKKEKVSTKKKRLEAEEETTTVGAKKKRKTKHKETSRTKKSSTSSNKAKAPPASQLSKAKAPPASSTQKKKQNNTIIFEEDDSLVSELDMQESDVSNSDTDEMLDSEDKNVPVATVVGTWIRRDPCTKDL